MRVQRQAVMRVLANIVMSFAGMIHRIDVDHDERQVIQLVQEMMPYFGSNRMRAFDGHLRIYGNIDFRMQPMPEPTGSYLRHLFNVLNVAGSFTYLSNNIRIDAIQHPGEDRFPALDHNSQNGDGDQ